MGPTSNGLIKTSLQYSSQNAKTFPNLNCQRTYRPFQGHQSIHQIHANSMIAWSWFICPFKWTSHNIRTCLQKWSKCLWDFAACRASKSDGCVEWPWWWQTWEEFTEWFMWEPIWCTKYQAPPDLTVTLLMYLLSSWGWVESCPLICGSRKYNVIVKSNSKHETWKMIKHIKQSIPIRSKLLIIANGQLNVPGNDAILLGFLPERLPILQWQHFFSNLKKINQLAFTEFPASSKISAQTYSMTPVK